MNFLVYLGLRNYDLRPRGPTWWSALAPVDEVMGERSCGGRELERHHGRGNDVRSSDA